ncbi:MAG: topoisomerase 3 [Pseudomonadota bacterium]
MGARVRVPVCVHVRMRARETGLYEMKTLVIAEKPSVAQDIVRALTPIAGKFEKHEDHFESETYVVTSAVGHLVEIQAPEKFDVKRGKWSFAHLPVIPPYFDLKPVDNQNAPERGGEASQAQRRERLDQRLRCGA